MDRDERRKRRLLALIPQDGEFILPRRDIEPTTQARLRAAVSGFVTGYRLGVQCDCAHVLLAQLEAIDASLAGFAYEGAGMALVCSDAFNPREPSLVALFLDVCDEPRSALLSIGAGWAQARLERPATELPNGLTVVCQPFVEDGYGFHQGLFQSYRFRAKRTFPFTSTAFDYGLGRSLWFVCGTDPIRVHEFIQKFTDDRHAALWRGIGVACAFTGGVSGDALLRLRDTAGDYREDLRRGVESANDIYATIESLPPSVQLAKETLLASD